MAASLARTQTITEVSPAARRTAAYSAAVDYEYRAVFLPTGADRRQTKEVLAIHAEYGGWELDRHTLWSDGRRRVTVRRRVREQQPPLAT